jgi:AcrR family transcriptional regulator
VAARRIDRRVRRTRDAIHRALIALILEKGYDRVTVADVIDRADIGRSTFYTHFTDKQHVLYASLDDLATFLRGKRDAAGAPLFGFSLALFRHAHEQRPLLRALLGRRSGAAVQARVRHVLAELVDEDLTAAGIAPPGVARELVVAGVVGAYLALLARWLDEGDPHTPEDMDAGFRRLVIPGISHTPESPATLRA